MEAFKDLHKYMIALTLSGHIGRQEAVSMLPPMFLDVQKDDIVLDMCAAPGSKTLQILEKLQKQGGSGIVVANDADSKRAYLLVHQVSHLKSSRIIVTTHLGQQYPFLRSENRGCGELQIRRRTAELGLVHVPERLVRSNSVRCAVQRRRHAGSRDLIG